MLPLPFPDLPSLLAHFREEGEEAVSLFPRHAREREAQLFAAFPGDGGLTLTLRAASPLAARGASLLLQNEQTDETFTLSPAIERVTATFTEYIFRPARGEREGGGVSPSGEERSCAAPGEDSPAIVGLFSYTFRLESALGDLIVSQGGSGVYACSLSISGEDVPRAPFPLLLFRPDFTTPAWVKGGIYYQIFIDRFARGTARPPPPLREGSRLSSDWEGGIPEYAEHPGDPLDNRLFFGGTLDGITDHLDDLALLGVNCLYLTPIFEARSNHKYDTGDYETVDPGFGGEEALARLLSEAKKRGIRVLLDGVFNHTGDDSRYFNRYGSYKDLGAAQSPDSPYYSWYNFTHYPSEYECWWGIDILPRVRSGEPSYIDYLCGEGGVLQKYLRAGAAGFRLDVADELDERLLTAIRARVKKENPDALVLGEVWEDASNKVSYGNLRHYFWGEQLDGVMNYPLREALLAYLTRGDAEALARTLRTLYAHYPKEASDVAMNLLGSHDTERILTMLAGAPLAGQSNAVLAERGYMSEEEKRPFLPRLMLAYALLCFLPGVPMIYYGDEAGMDGYRDPFNRRPYPWGREILPLRAFFRKVGAARRETPLLARGYYREVDVDGAGFAFERYDGERRLLFLANSGENSRTFALREPMRGFLASPGIPLPLKATRQTLPPVSFVVLRPTREGE